MTAVPPRPADAPGAWSRAPAAGALRRLLATFVDMVVFVALSGVLVLPLVRTAPADDLSKPLDLVAEAASDTAWMAHAAGVGGLWIALWWSYFLVGWGLAGATPGKALLGLRVVDHSGRCPIGATRAALRLIAYCCASATLGLGHLLILVRHDRRALHDLLAGTRVVRAGVSRNGQDSEIQSSENHPETMKEAP